MKKETIKHLIVMIDEKINQQLNIIIHKEKFQRLEATWRGIYFLTTLIKKENNNDIKIKILHAEYNELIKDFYRCNDFELSFLFKKIYTDELDHPGGEPFGLIIGDYFISHKNDHYGYDGITFLMEMAKVATAGFSPFITSIAPSFLGIDKFNELKPHYQLNSIFQLPEYRRWHIFQESEESRFVGLVLPQVLMRKPYNKNEKNLNNLFFKEKIANCRHYLWGNACYYFASAVIQSYHNSGWFLNIASADIPNEHLTTRHYFNTDNVNIAVKPITNISITDKQEKEFNDLGFIILEEDNFAHQAFFHNCPSSKKTKPLDNALVEMNTRISTILPCILSASRFAHYIKIMLREKIGVYLIKEEIENFLNQWIRKYCAINSDLIKDIKYKYPLQEAYIKLNNVPSQPGKYFCIMYLKPHYLIDGIEGKLKLVSTIKKQFEG